MGNALAKIEGTKRPAKKGKGGHTFEAVRDRVVADSVNLTKLVRTIAGDDETAERLWRKSAFNFVAEVVIFAETVNRRKRAEPRPPKRGKHGR